ncbi:MAG TPA: GntR family transcriptional regulator [Acidimicrobiia bacterium]|nr:GntR family transcriptional regulator [Acidimicrobiia bacterium]
MLRPTTAREFVRDQLRQQILSGEVPGGARLVQTQVASDFKVSTTPVREALLDLASEGLVRFDSHRGAVVSQPNIEELWETFELRRVLEPMVMRLAVPKMTPDIADRLDHLCDRMEATTNPVEWVPLNREFHGVFMDICQSPRLAAFVGVLHDSAMTFLTTAMRFRPEMMDYGNRDHRIMANAAREGDMETATTCASDHMNITMTAAKGLFGGSAPVTEAAMASLSEVSSPTS